MVILNYNLLFGHIDLHIADTLASIAPIWTPRLLLQVMAAPLSGITTALLTNPMDIIRARIQVCIYGVSFYIQIIQLFEVWTLIIYIYKWICAASGKLFIGVYVHLGPSVLN